jgi:hypothetical protein
LASAASKLKANLARAWRRSWNAWSTGVIADPLGISGTEYILEIWRRNVVRWMHGVRGQ